jgi:cytochrome P450
VWPDDSSKASPADASTTPAGGSPLRTAEFHRDPYPTYRVLRDRYPVFHDDGRDAFVLTRFADVAEAARDHETFSSYDPHSTVLDRMTRMDPPRHGKWRDLTSAAFRHRVILRHESRVRDITRGLLGRAGRGTVIDTVRDFAAPIPSTTIGDLIGVPRGYNERFHALSEISIAGSPADADEANREIWSVFEDLIASRRNEPQDDIITLLVNSTIDDRLLTHDELLGYCLHLVVAGNDTTANLIATGIRLLADHPEIRRALVSRPSLISQAVEEMVRFDGPVQMLPRTTTRAIELHGVAIPSQASIELQWGAANRDDRQFPDPDRFDVDRDDLRHLGFGYGIHFCLGAHLARLEARLAFEELLAWSPGYRLVADQDLVFKAGWAIRGLRQLLVELP